MFRARIVPATVVLFAAGLGLSQSGRAEDLPVLTPDQSASLQRAIRLWDAGLLAMDPLAPVTVTPADGHYNVSFPLTGWMTAKPDTTTGSASAQATLDADGHWHLEDIALSSPLVVESPVSAGEKLVKITQDFGTQNGSAVIDPTLATASTGDWRSAGWTMRVEGHGPAFLATADQFRSQRDINPASPGRADLASLVTMSGVAAHQDVPAGETSTDGVTVRTVTLTTQSANIDIDRLIALLPRAVAFARTVQADQKPVKLTPEQRSEAHDLLGLARNLADGVKTMISLEGIKVTASDRTGTLDRLEYSQALSAPDGRADTKLRLELAGLSLPFLPPGVIGELIPHRFVLAPSFDGPLIDDVVQVMNEMVDAVEPRPDAIAADVEARLAKAPVTAGIDELSFDVGPSQLTAHGSVTVTSPQQIDGTAHVAVTGLDGLIQLTTSNPLLRQAVPVLIFVKGLGQTKGDETVWEIAWHSGKLTVNGTDMSNMLPGRK